MLSVKVKDADEFVIESTTGVKVGTRNNLVVGLHRHRVVK